MNSIFDAYSVSLSELVTYPPEAISDFHFYGFEWIDNLHFLKRPSDIIENSTLCTNLEKIVSDRFKAEGWEGTGKLSLLWLPPFVFPPNSNISPLGVIVWHVKQHEDGLSWMLSPHPLPFPEFGYK